MSNNDFENEFSSVTELLNRNEHSRNQMQNQERDHFEEQRQEGPGGEDNDLTPKLTAHPSLDLNALEKQALEYQK